MRKFWKLTTVTGVAAVLASVVAMGSAGAITSAPAGYGFDGHPDLIVGGGSDTTAKVMLAISDLYNASAINNGCHHSQNTTATTTPTGPNSVYQNACDPTDEPFNLSNWDGDTVGQANPTGSGAGRAALEGLNGGQYEGTARPLANPSRTDNVTFTASSVVVLDASITQADKGKLVTIGAPADANLPQPVYVGDVVDNVSFKLSASASSQQDEPYLSGVVTNPVGQTIKISRYGCIAAGPTIGNVNDIGRSSSTAGGLAGCVNSSTGPAELGASTFWGFGRDMVEVYGFNGNGTKLNGLGALTANQLYSIFVGNAANTGTLCGASATLKHMTWHDLDPVAWPNGDPYATADIIPWGMNSASGTYNTFRDFIRTNTVPAQGSFDPDTSTCVRGLDGGTTNFPLENDIKPLINDPATLSTVPTSPQNPQNWIHWASFGVFSAFPYSSNFTRSATAFQATAAAVNGVLPSTSLTSTYPITRILWNVTRKGDADCPAIAVAATPPQTGTVRKCDFAGQPGPVIGAGPTTDLNVAGASTGPGGAVRELMRYICRGTAAQHGLDPFTGVNAFTQITGALIGAGFTVLPTANRTPGSRCNVVTN